MSFCSTCPFDDLPFSTAGSLTLCARCTKTLTEFLSAAVTTADTAAPVAKCAPCIPPGAGAVFSSETAADPAGAADAAGAAPLFPSVEVPAARDSDELDIPPFLDRRKVATSATLAASSTAEASA